MWNMLIVYNYLLIVITVLVTIYLKNYFKSVVLAFKFPGPPALPFFGHVFLIKDSKYMEYLGTNVSYIYGSIVKFWFSILPIFFITEPSHLQIIIGNSKCSTKNMFYTFLPNLIGEGLVTSTGYTWKLHRKLIQPYFHINFLKEFFHVFQKYSDSLVDNLSEADDINFVHLSNKFVLEVMHEVVFGVPVDKETSPFRGCKISLLDRSTKPWLLINSLFKMTETFKEESEVRGNIQDYTKMQVRNRKKFLENIDNPKKYNVNLMEMMIEISKNNPEFTEKDVINETSSFILVGQDSVATALAFSLYFIAAHQDVQERIMLEQKEIFKNTNRPATLDDVTEMKYLEQCIRETLRLCPSLPMLARKLTRDVYIEKQCFPAGTNILLSPFATHRLPHVFQNPLKFDPDRFSPENKAKMHPYAYIPFSAGPRNCIGYKFALIELKTVISHLLRNYHVSLTPGHETLKLLYSVTLKAKGGIWLRLDKRAVK